MSESDEKRTQEEESADVEGHRLLSEPTERLIAREDEDEGPEVEGHHFGRPHKGRSHKGRA